MLTCNTKIQLKFSVNYCVLWQVYKADNRPICGLFMLLLAVSWPKCVTHARLSVCHHLQRKMVFSKRCQFVFYLSLFICSWCFGILLADYFFHNQGMPRQNQKLLNMPSGLKITVIFSLCMRRSLFTYFLLYTLCIDLTLLKFKIVVIMVLWQQFYVV